MEHNDSYATGTVQSLMGQHSKLLLSEMQELYAVFYTDSNLCVTQFDPVFIYGVPCAPAPVLLLYPLSDAYGQTLTESL